MSVFAAHFLIILETDNEEDENNGDSQNRLINVFHPHITG